MKQGVPCAQGVRREACRVVCSLACWRRVGSGAARLHARHAARHLRGQAAHLVKAAQEVGLTAGHLHGGEGREGEGRRGVHVFFWGVQY